MAPNQRGIARISGEGIMWTSSSRLSHLNGGRWKVEGEVNTIKETVKSGVTSTHQIFKLMRN